MKNESKIITAISLFIVLIIFNTQAFSDECRINLNTASVLGKNESSRDEPYLWTFGFAVDAQTFINNQFILKIDNPGHGNLGSGVGEGYSLVIPTKTGALKKELIVPPNQEAMYCGVITLIFEEDSTPPNSAVIEAYESVAEILRVFIRDIVVPNRGIPDDLRPLKDSITAEVRRIYRAASSFPWDVDDFIGFDYASHRISPGEVSQNPIELLLWNKRESYEGAYLINGSIDVGPPLPLPPPRPPSSCPSGYTCCGATLPDGRCDDKCVKPPQSCK
jgi:hypothetical protein